MDYVKEVKELEAYESKKWFKPTKGTYKIQVVSEGVFVTKNFDGENTEQWNLDIKVNDQPMSWSVTKGRTMSSLYGQIIYLASANNNQAQGLNFTLIVKNDGKKNDYTIPEALNQGTVSKTNM